MAEYPDQITLGWLRERQSGLGGTDKAALVLNKDGSPTSKWATPLTVYIDKTTEIEPRPPTFAMQMGHEMEPLVAARYERELREDGELKGCSLVEVGLVRHVTETWAIGTPDRMIVDVEGRWLWGLECKLVGFPNRNEWGPTGSTKVPAGYYVQCMHYLNVCKSHHPDMVRWDLAINIGGSADFRRYRFAYDETTAWGLMEVGRDFWANHVLKRIPPDPLPGTVDSKALDRRWKESVQTRLSSEKDSALDILGQDLVSIRQEIADLKTKESGAVNSMKSLIGDCDGADGEDWSVTWRRNKPRAQTNWKAIVDECKVPDDIIENNTEFQMGARPFRFKEHTGDPK